MPITLQTLAAAGETAYIAKHNANISALVAFLNSLESSLASVTGASTGLANASNIGSATYGTGSGMAFVGSESFADSTAGTDMTVQGGFCWDSTLGLMHYKEAATVLPFAGKAPATYFIRFDGADNPYVDTISTGAIYSVVWAGSSFGTITQLASVTPSAPDIGDLASSAYSGITYLTPAERLAATEKAFSDLLDANMSTGDYIPAAALVMEAIGVRLTGAVATSCNLIVPNKDKVLLVRNEFTTANASTVTVKTAAGTGIALLAGEHALLYCDGTNVFHIFRQGGATPVSSLLHLSDVPDSYDGHGLKLLRVRGDETGTEFVSPAAVVAPSVLAVKDETVLIDAAVAGMNFEGAGVLVEQTAAGQVKITIPGAGAAGAPLAVQDDGVAVDAATVLINFAGDGVTVTQTAAGQILVTIPGASAGSADYDLAFYIGDKRPAGAVAYRHTFAKAVDFPANFGLSQADAVAGAAATAVFLIKKNGVQVGTLTFSTGSAAGAFATSGGAAVSFLAGDILEVTAPDPQDSTLTGVSITMAGSRA